MLIDAEGDLKLANFGAAKDTREVKVNKETGKETHSGEVGTL